MPQNEGKQKYIASVAAELSTRGKIITRATTLLIDDDVNNIRVALMNDTRAIWFDPNEPARY